MSIFLIFSESCNSMDSWWQPWNRRLLITRNMRSPPEKNTITALPSSTTTHKSANAKEIQSLAFRSPEAAERTTDLISFPSCSHIITLTLGLKTRCRPSGSSAGVGDQGSAGCLNSHSMFFLSLSILQRQRTQHFFKKEILVLAILFCSFSSWSAWAFSVDDGVL